MNPTARRSTSSVNPGSVKVYVGPRTPPGQSANSRTIQQVPSAPPLANPNLQPSSQVPRTPLAGRTIIHLRTAGSVRPPAMPNEPATQLKLVKQFIAGRKSNFAIPGGGPSKNPVLAANETLVTLRQLARRSENQVAYVEDGHIRFRDKPIRIVANIPSDAANDAETKQQVLKELNALLQKAYGEQSGKILRPGNDLYSNSKKFVTAADLGRILDKAASYKGHMHNLSKRDQMWSRLVDAGVENTADAHEKVNLAFTQKISAHVHKELDVPALNGIFRELRAEFAQRRDSDPIPANQRNAFEQAYDQDPN
jgi:hypothetical protein